MTSFGEINDTHLHLHMFLQQLQMARVSGFASSGYDTDSFDVEMFTLPKFFDPEKLKRIQRQLVVLIHARKCACRETESTRYANCSLNHCHAMKQVLIHLINCKKNQDCTIPQCWTSRQIIEHWKICVGHCLVCSPLKEGGHFTIFL